jgi:hypothetical protein
MSTLGVLTLGLPVVLVYEDSIITLGGRNNRIGFLIALEAGHVHHITGMDSPETPLLGVKMAAFSSLHMAFPTCVHLLGLLMCLNFLLEGH